MDKSSTGNETEKLEEIKEIIKQEIQNKNTRIVSVILNIDSDINSIDSEIKRLQELKRVKKNTLDRLKSNIKDCMELLGTKKVETVLGNISIRKSAGSLVIEDEEKIPAIYKTVEQVVKVDKTTFNLMTFFDKVFNGIFIYFYNLLYCFIYSRYLFFIFYD
ncbi:siphovirus Gp157 family protein [Clostridioides difficile]|uniref:siphovirus Gp157 family protein n=1 Tax=Clostridioides difficile TaxID=1496 RepID=UPI0030D1DD6B